jgi:hypothetical protein
MTSQQENVCPQSAQERISRIRQLNDALRKGRGEGQMLVTPGITGLDKSALADVVQLVQAFDDFSTNNDPYGEHDFGAFSYRGERVFWKIDYYDTSLRFGSEDPADPAGTIRVLTIMLARDY